MFFGGLLLRTTVVSHRMIFQSIQSDLCQFLFFYVLCNKFMIAKHLEKINNLLNKAKTETEAQNDSIALISTHMARTKTTANTSFRTRSKTTSSSIYKKIPYRKDQITVKLENLLNELFKAKCKDLKIQVNKNSWELFIKTFVIKNKISQGNIATQCLNLTHFGLTPSCLPHINTLICQNNFSVVNLSNNRINPTKINSLNNIKQLILNNCKLGNDVLEPLFDKLVDSSIVKISLSSPQLKDRNQLTRYEKLQNLIKKSKTLETLLLSNIEIQPENGLLQCAKSSTLRHIDLSDNTNVRGINPTILSLNLSRNAISTPFELPIPPCQLQYFNLSYNKIPYYYFKSFLKTTYFPSLQVLILDRIQLNGSIYPIQQFLEHSRSMNTLSIVECDLTIDSYLNLTAGVKGSNSLKKVDFSRNRIVYEKIAEALSNMIQGGSLTHLKMRHCDIKDHLGALIFKDINKSHAIQSIDMMNNLLGDDTAKTICKELKMAKTITELKLDQNIIKYKDQEEIQSYLKANRYLMNANLNLKYRQLRAVNKQQEQKQRKLLQEEQKCMILQQQTEQLEKYFYEKFKVTNHNKKQYLKRQIDKIRKLQTTVQEQLFIRQTLAVAYQPSPSPSLRQRDSIIDNPEFVINLESPRAECS